MQIGYAFKEAGISIRRNLLMTVAAISVVATSLFLVGSSLLLRQAVSRFSEKWQGAVEMSIFMEPDASQSQIDAIDAELEHLKVAGDQVCSYSFVNKQGAYEEISRFYEDKPELVANLRPEDLPTSYRVKPCDAEYTKSLQDTFKDKAGVEQARAPVQLVERTLQDASDKRNASLIIAGVLLFTAMILIFVTVQLAIYARRREVSVMKLVGATNWFIRIPFMLEGILQSVLGALVAFLALYLTRNGVVGLVSTRVVDNLQLSISSHEAIVTGLVVTAFGAICGAVSSYLSTVKYLRV